ncbi:hypothetical protein ACLB1E_21230 [Escherichia coli]
MAGWIRSPIFGLIDEQRNATGIVCGNHHLVSSGVVMKMADWRIILHSPGWKTGDYLGVAIAGPMRYGR